MIATIRFPSKTRLLACIFWSIAACSTAAHAQNSSSNSPKNCASVVLTAEERIFWQSKVFVPIWKDSCDRTLKTGEEVKCLLLTWIKPTHDPNQPNDIENPIFNRLLEDKRYAWELGISATYPVLNVPFGYKIVYPKGCKR